MTSKIKSGIHRSSPGASSKRLSVKELTGLAKSKSLRVRSKASSSLKARKK